jgi:hypothetical protein
MSTILIQSNTLRDAKRLFGRLKHLRCKLPVLRHLLLTAGPDGIRIADTDLDHWLETRVCDDGFEPLSFLIPPEAMEAICRGDRGSIVVFTSFGGRRTRDPGLTIQSGGIEATSDYPRSTPRSSPNVPKRSASSLSCRLPPWKVLLMSSVAHPSTPPATSSTACCSLPRTADA